MQNSNDAVVCTMQAAVTAEIASGNTYERRGTCQPAFLPILQTINDDDHDNNGFTESAELGA